MLRIGHRGAAGYEPENTLRSFQKAIDLKVDMIEFDAYVCRSGEIVIIHDDKVDRTTNGHGYVVEKSLTELKQLDAGQGEKIPSLEEALNLINRRAKVNLELKGQNTVGPVYLMIKKYIMERGWRYDDFMVSSFDHHQLLEFKDICPQVKIGALTTGIPLGFSAFAEKLDAFSVNLSLEFINQEFVKDAHWRGLKVFVWTVNDKDDIERMKDLGVDGIFTNYPDRVK